jgi:guanylate kinase
LSIFLAPLSKDEIQELRRQPDASLSQIVAELMRGKLLRRTRRQKNALSSDDLRDIENRAARAYGTSSLIRWAMPEKR